VTSVPSENTKQRLVALPWRQLGAVLGIVLGLWLAYLAVSKGRQPDPVATPAPLTLAENEAGKVGDLTLTTEAIELAEIHSAPAQLRVVKEKLSVSGVIQTGGDQVAKVTPRAAGKVVKLLAQVGDDVSVGQTLAILESAELAQAQAEYRQAVAESRAQESNLVRQRELARLGQFGRPQVEESRTRSVESERAVHEARHQMAEERARLQQAQAERDVLRARWQRAESLKELVSRQERERVAADLKKAEADMVAARVRLEGAEGELVLAEKSRGISQSALAREEKVYTGGHLTSRELVEAQSAAQMARVRVDSAAERVTLLGGTPGQGSDIALVSPIRGKVQELAVTLGETVPTDRAAYTIVNLDQVWAQLALSPKDLPKIRLGDPVELSADSAPGRIFQGKIAHVSSGSDDATRAVYVRTLLKNPDGALKTGSYVRGNLITAIRHQQLTVPDGALQEHTGRPTLYVQLPGKPGAFEVRHVLLGARGDKWREISKGLKPGEAVATSGTFYLKSQALKSSLSDGCCGGD
jgi:RND family efflux transporter MFP subunit